MGWDAASLLPPSGLTYTFDKWRQAMHRGVRYDQITISFFLPKRKTEHCSAAAAKQDPTPSLSSEAAPHYQLRPSKINAIAERPSFLSLRVLIEDRAPWAQADFAITHLH